MKNKNILFLVGGVILIGGIFFYQYKYDIKDVKGIATKGEDEKIVQTIATETTKKENSVKEKSGAVENNFKKSESKIVYYYGSECPHCTEVLAYLEENKIYDKVDFIKKEIWHDKDNGKELTEAALKCGLDPSKIGVPFVFSDGKCYMGGPEVTSFFADKAGIKK